MHAQKAQCNTLVGKTLAIFKIQGTFIFFKRHPFSLLFLFSSAILVRPINVYKSEGLIELKMNQVAQAIIKATGVIIIDLILKKNEQSIGKI